MRAVICGYYGLGNIGDEALLVSLLQMLPPQVIPVVLSGNPEQTRHRYGVVCCDRRSPRAIFQALRQADVFIWGGGSLMQDVTSLASPLYYGSLMLLAQMMGLKTLAWAQGIGPLKRPFIRWFTRQVLRRCTAISVRDNASARLMSDWQLKVTLAPDPVWALTATSVADIQQLAAPRVAIILRPHPQLTPGRLKLLTQALIEFQQKTHTNVLLVPFQPAHDLAIAQTIAEQLPGPHDILSLDDPTQMKGLFRDVEMVIGMRLHSLIMAAAEGCRCFALSYDPKVTQLMAQVDMPGWEMAALPQDAHFISQSWLAHYVNDTALTVNQIQSLCDRALIHRDLCQHVCQTP